MLNTATDTLVPGIAPSTIAAAMSASLIWIHRIDLRKRARFAASRALRAAAIDSATADTAGAFVATTGAAALVVCSGSSRQRHISQAQPALTMIPKNVYNGPTRSSAIPVRELLTPPANKCSTRGESLNSCKSPNAAATVPNAARAHLP